MADLDGAIFDGAVKVAEAGPRGMIALKGDLRAEPLRELTSAIVGVPFPGASEATSSGETAVCWMAPDEVLILLPRDGVNDALARISEALDGTHHLAADVSDARAVFSIAGAGAREVLAKLTPADLRPGVFGPGQFRRTRLGQVAAAFRMTDEATFEVICFRSVARYVFDLLSNAARPGTLPDHF